MLLLVYEYVTGGGLWSEPNSNAEHHPLLAEGSCMVQAIGEDLARVGGIELVQLRDVRLASVVSAAGTVIEVRSEREELDQLAHWSARADGTLLIAPEHDGRLLKRCEIVQENKGKLISPDPTFVRLTTDKHATAERLAAAGVPTPQAVLLEPPSPPHPLTPSPPHPLTPSLPHPLTYPAVLKPVDGVGSLDTRLLEGPEDWRLLAGELSEGRRAAGVLSSSTRVRP